MVASLLPQAPSSTVSSAPASPRTPCPTVDDAEDEEGDLEVDAPSAVALPTNGPRAIVWLCTTLLACALGVAVFGRLEQTGEARGVLRYAGGAQTMSAQATGVVGELRVRPGDVVAAGQVIVTLESASGQASFLEANRAVARGQSALADFAKVRRPLHRERRRMNEGRVALLGARAANLATSIERMRARARIHGSLREQGVGSKLDEMTAIEDLANAERERLRILEEIAAANVAIAGFEQEIEAEEARLRAELRRAEDQRDSIALGISQSGIVAQRAGRVDAVLVKAGETVTVGSPVVRLLPVEAPLQVVAFVPERQRGFVREGMEARAELDQFPAAEFGHVSLVVVRVGSELASTAEVKEVLGDAQPIGEVAVHRVELAVVPAKTPEALRATSGALVSTRYVLRKRRLLFILVDPLRRVFE